MDVKGSISITGKRLSVSSVITESFVYETSDLASHVVSVNMTDGGYVTMKIDGEENSSYRKEIDEAHVVDEYVDKLYQRMAGAYNALSDYYLKIYAKSERTLEKSEVRRRLKTLECHKYKEKAFETEKPVISEIEADLRVDAEGEGLSKQNDIDKYIASHIEDSYNYRLLKWEKIREYHNDIQKVIANKENENYLKQYEVNKQNLQDILEGSPSYICKKMKELETQLKLSFSTDIDYCFNPDNGVLDLEFISPQNLSLPDKKVRISDSGKYEIININKTEYFLNQTISKLATMFYLAWSVWNITTNIKTINIKNWKDKNLAGWCWFSFERDFFAKLDPSNFNLLEVCKDVKHVFDLKDNSLHPLHKKLFEYAIQKGKYDDSTLMSFVNKANAIDSYVYEKESVETPILEEIQKSPSINDLDYGYVLSSKPVFDHSFANWCYKLIEYEECSLTMFVKDWGLSLDGAKDFMRKLLYMHFVGGKFGDGRRKVLISSEAELEYKLSWIYPNESWKY